MYMYMLQFLSSSLPLSPVSFTIHLCHMYVFPLQRVPRKPRPPPASKPSKPPEAVPAKKAINHAVNVNTYAPSPIYDKDINPYAKSATASALDAVGEIHEMHVHNCVSPHTSS